MNKKIIIIIVAAVILMGAGAAAYILVFSDNEKPPTYTPFPVGEFVTNINDSYYIFKSSVTLVLTSDDDKLAETLSANLPYIREVIIFILSDLTEDEINDPKTVDILKEKISKAINEQVPVEKFEDYVHTVWFSDFVMN